MKPARRSSKAIKLYLPALFVCVTALLLLSLGATRMAHAVEADPVLSAWEQARAAGSYHFSSNVVQVVLPSSTIANVGRSSRTEKLYLEGESDLRSTRLEFQLWSEGGSLLQDGSAISVRVEDGKTFVRQGTGEWQESGNLTDALAPQGDFLAYLHAMRDVTAHPAETRAGITFTRYSFQLDGPAFAAFVRAQTEEAMRQKGEMLAGTRIDIPSYYSDMTGEGELWVGSDGLPLRQILTLRFPEHNAESVHAQITVDFSQFGEPTATLGGFPLSGGLGSILSTLPLALPNLIPMLVLSIVVAFILTLVRYRHVQGMQKALVVAIITNLVIGPLLSTFQLGSFIDAQSAKAAAETAQSSQSEMARDLATLIPTPDFHPQVNPVQAAETRALATARLNTITTGLNLPPVAPTALLTDDGTDSDADGLSDFTEERVGTDPGNADTDADGLTDGKEVRGFTLAGKTWYADALNADSNNDGIADTLEWDANGDGQWDDTDNDGLPNIFDEDNDNDRVPDRKDMAPFTAMGGTGDFSESSPFNLSLQNLQANIPTLVDFQVRPQNQEHLWFAFNVLDWPQDGEAQIHNIDQATYADLAAAAGRSAEANEEFGDMKLVPMLEVRMDTANANLPPQSDLTPYGISVNPLTEDASRQVSYVPLTIVTDEQSGQRVAFNARMRYQPTGQWTTPHEVRLVWVVQVLQDIPCNAEDPDEVAQGCAADGYYHNVPQMVQSYYDQWSLSGLTVREEHGTSVAIIYEDPLKDNDLKDDAALVSLSHGLENTFLAGRDEDGNDQRDVDLSEIVRRFDHPSNTGVGEIERWSIPDILRVERQAYDSFDQAMIFTAMTDTKQVLASAFDAAWATDNQIKPLLTYAHESSIRTLGLDGAGASGGYISISPTGATFNMQPAGQARAPIDVMVGLKWTPYCAPAAGSPQWSPCDADIYWEELEQRHAAFATQPGDPADTDVEAGRVMVMQLYSLAMIQGVNQLVQSDARLVSSIYSMKSDSELETTIRTVGAVAKAGVPAVANIALMARYVNKIPVLQYLGNMLKQIRGNLRAPVTGAIASFKSNPRAGGAIILAAAAVITTLAIIIAQYDLAQQITIKVAIIGITTFLSVISPILAIKDWVQAVKLVGGTAGSVLRAGSAVLGTARAAGVIGAVIGIAIAWGFFIYSMVASNVTAFSPEFNKGLAEAIAATIYLILLAVISATVVGLIIVGIVGVIDGILTAICELGVDELRTVPGLGGACFTLSNVAIKAIAYLLYNYDVMVDTSRNDLVVVGSPDVTLADPSKGYVEGNALSVNLPITTTAIHKDPDPANGLYINLYLWLFSQDNLRSSTFRYSLTQPNPQTIDVELDQMTSTWQGVSTDHNYVLTPMYRGQARSGHAPITGLTPEVGLNRSVPFYLNMGYAVPAYECWGIPNIIPAFFPPIIPVCYTSDLKGNSSSNVDTLKFDIFPATLDGFMTLATKADGGLGLNWDSAFPSLHDADGDGLRSSAHAGLDPNDARADTDNDGLADAYELERRQAGLALSPIQSDTDNDGLTDRQEMQFGTDPGRADTDNDGLTDGTELWHQEYNTSTGQPTGAWVGGWDVSINAATPFTVRVSSDPLDADADADGVSDQAERQLAMDPNPANRLDNQNRPYHPSVANTPPLEIHTAIADADGVVGPSQSFVYTTTVVANTPMAPSVLDVTVPGALGSSPVPYALGFNPATFNGSQSVTQQTSLTVPSGSTSQTVTLNSAVRGRLQGSPSTGWTFGPITSQPPLGVAPDQYPIYGTEVEATRQDRQDSFLLTSQRDFSGGGFSFGHTEGFDLLEGHYRALETNTATPTEYFLTGTSGPSSAANSRGNTLVTWDHLDRCNTITIHSLRVVIAGEDNGTPGIEPYIVLEYEDHYNPDEEDVWYWDAAGGSDQMQSGHQRGPNAGGFPITRTICGSSTLRVMESDGPVNDPALNELVGQTVTDPWVARNNQLMHFIGAGHVIELFVTVPVKDHYTITGEIVGPTGNETTALSFPRSTVPTAFKQMNRHPVVASNGDGFLVAYETITTTESSYSGSGTEGPMVLLTVQAFDRNGNPQGTNHRSASSNNLTNSQEQLGLDVAWIGDRYRVVWKAINSRTIYAGDFTQTAANFGGNSGWTTVATDSAMIPDNQSDRAFDYTPRLAYDPITGRWLLSYTNSSPSQTGILNVYANASSTTALRTLPLVSGAHQMVPVYHPVTQHWLVSVFTKPSYRDFYHLPADLTGQSIQWASWQTNGSQLATSLACPSLLSVPLADLRFEEAPGSTSFADQSGRGNNATGTGSTAPAAGVPGAPNAPLSDYALRFDGTDDVITLPRRVQDSFSIAFWIKASQSNTQQMLVDGGVGQSNGFGLWLNNGVPTVEVSQSQAAASARIDNGQWRFVTVSRTQETGQVVVRVDGSSVINVTRSTAALAATATWRLGKQANNSRPFRGDLDHLQLFQVALSSEMVQAIYNRTQQSYCAAAQTTPDNSEALWTKVQLTQPDTRGGRISASGGLNLIIDGDRPTVSLDSLQPLERIQGGRTVIIGGSAGDVTSSIARVEVSINSGPYQSADGAETWTFPLQVTDGPYAISMRATDVAGNQSFTHIVSITADATPPTVTLAPLPTTPVVPTRNNEGQWLASLHGTLSDASGIAAGSVEVLLEAESGVGPVNAWQPATVSGNTWALDYRFPVELTDPTGSYRVSVRASDSVLNRSADDAATGILRLDSTGPVATLEWDAARTQVITETLSLSGRITDTNSVAGLDTLEIAFTPVEQVAALPGDITSDESEAQLNRTWHPVALDARGPGVASTRWSFAVPSGLENQYQIDLRATDLLGNESLTVNVWRGVVDTLAPRVALSVTPTGASYWNPAIGATLHEVTFTCAAEDRHLTELGFICPGNSEQPPTRSFDINPAVQALFPDLTLRDGLFNTWTLWAPTTTPSATVEACDSFGHCASDSTPLGALNGMSTMMAPTPGAPLATIVSPSDLSYVAAEGSVLVTVAAEAGASLQSVTLRLDGTDVQTLSFAQSDAVKRTQRTLSIPITGEGLHTLEARATDWSGVTQGSPFAMSFTLDSQAPSASFDDTSLTIADTYGLQSDILRFHGTAADSVGLATVQVRVGDNPFVDATFGDGTWQTALAVPDPEGQTLVVMVRAIDRAGRVTTTTEEIGVDLASATPPETSFTSTPSNPSSANPVSFSFEGTSGGQAAAGFACRLDEGAFEPCTSPWQYSDLSKGSHTVAVRAIDGQGYVDPSPASFSWTVSPIQPESFITASPPATTSSRSASFAFQGASGAVSFECALDSSGFSACTSPQSYTGLTYGDHTFLVRARTVSGGAGTPTAFTWTVLNTAPVADDQLIVTGEGESAPITLTASDSDTLSYEVVAGPTHGALLGVAPGLTYAPDAGFGGVDTFTFRANDGQSVSNIATVTIYVDSTPPTVTCSATPNSLWPANNKMVPVTTTVVVTDAQSGSAGFTLVSIVSNEAGTGDIVGWTVNTPDTSGQLRAKRAGSGNGRVYTLTYQGSDRSGNTATCSTTVVVPHDKGKNK